MPLFSQQSCKEPLYGYYCLSDLGVGADTRGNPSRNEKISTTLDLKLHPDGTVVDLRARAANSSSDYGRDKGESRVSSIQEVFRHLSRRPRIRLRCRQAIPRRVRRRQRSLQVLEEVDYPL